jgi:FAD/FMN-containing dehydrogenase
MSDLTGNLGSPQDYQNVSIHEAFRTAINVYTRRFRNPQEMIELYSMGESSYFSESAYRMDDYEQRYWGKNTERLKEIKKKYDPERFFTCHNCVGQEMTTDEEI